MNELAISIILLTIVKNFELLVCIVAVYISSIKPQAEKESGAKDRKILEILKNHFGQFYKLNTNSQQSTSY